jgi:NAD(P)-dependent dehydrogenase (short-subunit alcohol dehydrogenase family)
MEIKNNTFLVSGGASGLGLATSRMIIENGGMVAILDINDLEGEKAANELGANAIYIHTDVCLETSVKDAIKKTKEKFSNIKGVINCAGIGPAQRVLGKTGVHSLDFFSKIILINLIGTFNVLRLVAEEISGSSSAIGTVENGIIINTASVAAFDGQIGQAAYSASKGGIVAMTLPIARELARVGIRVMTIAPGIFETPLLASYTQEVRDSLGQQVPFPSRLGKPSEFAALVKHILENQMLNGEVIRLDGAIRMGAK